MQSESRDKDCFG